MKLSYLQKRTFTALLLLLFAGVCACRNNTERLQRDQVIIGIAADFDYLNPLLIQLSMSREICTLLYPSLVKPFYDEQKGNIIFLPNAAKSWTFSKDAKHVTFHLKNTVAWEDGKKVTAHDFKYSYALYKSPKIASARQHYLNDLLLLPDGTADIQRAVETPNDSTLVLHFNKPMASEIVLDHFNDLMPIAEHLFRSYRPDEIRAKASEIPVLSAGAFKIKKWAHQEKLELITNPSSTLPHPATIKSLIFVVVPEYTTRLAMLKSGQIDALISAGGINPKDIKELAKSSPSIVIKPVKNRYFDSIVWLNIDKEAWRQNHQIKPNPLFGDKNVRQALTFAIDRQSIIDGFMGPEHATVINTSLSPAYKEIISSSFEQYTYNPRKASALLNKAGWIPGPDGILQKNGKKFSFELAAPVGNPRRNYAATIVQQNLREIGIDCRLKFDESLVFLKKQNSFNYDAALSGLAAETLPFQLIIWGSDFTNRPFNSSAFQNSQLDTIIDKLSKPLSKENKLTLWKKYQQILHDEQPRTFLYYYDELEGINNRIRNTDINLISTFYNLYDWKVQ
ncbi:MAG: ABC transporter substrate-binding protein [Chlorobiaceae bacterium]